MTKLRLIAVLTLLLGSAAQADTLQMKGMSADGDGTRPTRGMSEASVEAKFGSPKSKQAAVGEPPISRWEYDGFVVYFEYDKVIHAVVKR
ncbi:MAG: hypothetical protein QNJ05_05920 [Woeseiaceae bacterium]|nr:hypothetical protein [Woeseiaceae bacterium]